MKAILYIVLFAFLLLSCQKTGGHTAIAAAPLQSTAPQDFAALDKKLTAQFDSIYYWYDRSYVNDSLDDLAYGRFEAANEVFLNHLQQVLNQPGALDYNFKLLDEKITIVASGDKKLRAFSWDTYMGGTMKDLRTVFQYKTPDGAATKIFTFTENNRDEEPELMHCLEIFSLETKSGMVYIPHTFMTESSKYYMETVKFLRIEGAALNPVALIKTDEGLTDEYGLEYIAYHGEEGKPEKVIDYDPKKRVLSFVKTDDEPNVLNAFDHYAFNGAYFEKIK
ncbi:MAG: hypothetical protein EOP54_18540 [Sphingobacteriales bacterium]|nr:MAG: hypothetical protein EOP54_18540 [Sphingobacteriales bacterium]